MGQNIRCIMAKQLHSKLIYKEIVVQKQSLEELVEDNKDYIAWLEKHRGKKAREAFIRHLKKELEQVPETGTKIKMPVVEVDVHISDANSNDIQKH